MPRNDRKPTQKGAGGVVAKEAVAIHTAEYCEVSRKRSLYTDMAAFQQVKGGKVRAQKSF